VPFQLGVPFLPPQELIGHLPIFAIMYLLLVHGPGLRFSTIVRWATGKAPMSLESATVVDQRGASEASRPRRRRRRR
jgi:hypothetical protein